MNLRTTVPFVVLAASSALFAIPAYAQDASATTSDLPTPAPTPQPVAIETTVTSTSTADTVPLTPKEHFGLSIGLQAGITYWTETSPWGTDNSIGRALTPGYDFGLRASFEVLPWFAIDARGMITGNGGNDLVNGGQLHTYSGLGALRFTAPIRYIKPYLLVGYGVHRVDASGAGSELVSGTFGAYEFGFGFLVPTSHHLEFGFEYLYSHLSGETISTNANADGGDPSAMSLFAQYRFGL